MMRTQLFVLAAVAAPLLLGTAPPAPGVVDSFKTGSAALSTQAPSLDSALRQQCPMHLRVPEEVNAENQSQAPRPAPPKGADALMPASLSRLPIVADGAKDPELIPMDLAYRYLIRSIAIQDTNPQPELLAHRDRKLKQIGIEDEADTRALATALVGVRTQVDGIHRERLDLDPSNPSTAGRSVELGQEERRVLDDAADRVRRSLGPAAAARLDAHVRIHVRRGIIIFGTMPE